jgi:iron(II)-dependent oxidoreductase
MTCSFAQLALVVLIAGSEEEAQVRYRIAEQAKEQSLLRLEAAYTRTETALQHWQSFERRQDPALLEALEAMARSAGAGDEGRIDSAEERKQRRRSREQLQREIETLLGKRKLEDEGLQQVLGELAVKAAFTRSSKKDLAMRLGEAFDDLLVDPAPFHEVWNNELYLRIPESEDYRERYHEYIAAGVELDRLRNPGHYEPGGRKVRTGMVYIPGGSYTVGPNSGFERKKHKVSIRPFLIDQFEVSNAQYVTFLEALDDEGRLLHAPRHWEPDERGRRAPPRAQLDHPVAGVTWRSANAYARFAGKRLPTEDEWEIACRGKEPTRYPWGEEYKEGRCNDSSTGLRAAVAIGRFAAGESPFGVHNMAGNVEEWTACNEDGDIVKELYSNIAPMVVRGGHFLSPPENVGGLFRWTAPGGSTRELTTGFRCAADLQ